MPRDMLQIKDTDIEGNGKRELDYSNLEASFDLTLISEYETAATAGQNKAR